MIKTTTYRPRRVTKVVTTKRDNRKSSFQAGKTRRRRRRRSRNQSNQLPDAIKQELLLISDPCHGPISRTIGVGSITERLRTSVSVPEVAARVSGFFIWFPTYHNGGSTQNTSNLLKYENATSSTVPINTFGQPFGMTSADTTGASLADPAYAVVTSAPFSRAKTHSACIQLNYIGALSAISGEVAIVKNFPLRGFFSNKTTIDLTPPSVDTIFAYASERQRLQATGHEVIWRPTDLSSLYRTNGNDRADVSMAPDSGWMNGNPAVTASTLCGTDSDEMYGICIAWRGIPATAGCLSVNVVKVVSLELAPSGASIEITPILNSPTTYNPVSTVTSWLDKYAPDWQSKAVNTTANVAGLLARAYAPKGVLTISSGLRGKQPLMIHDL